jgi:DMSO/TMAO reductase YedYZ molybdopterin-dependent catalytic subunit
MTKHICQGPFCHTYDTQSRIRGTKGSKVLRTRNARYDTQDNRYNDNEYINRWEFYFCDERCMNNWLGVHMAQLINYVGLKTKPQESPVDIVETTHKAWNGQDYTRTTIKLKENENNVLT